MMETLLKSVGHWSIDCLSLHLSDLALCLDLGQGANTVSWEFSALASGNTWHQLCDIKFGDLVKVVRVPFPFLNE